MKKVSLSGSLRENVGKKDAKKHRREGSIPCVIYGGEKQVHFVVDEVKFDKIIFTPDVYLITIDLGGEKYKTILQELQYHPVTDKVLHADFLELGEGKDVTIGIPVNLVGTSQGVMAGGQLIKKMHRLRLRGQVDNMPDNVEVDISSLVIGTSVKVKDIQLDNLALLDSPNSVIVRVKTSRNVAEDLEDEEGEEGEEGAEGEAGEGEAEEDGDKED
jgi:large subunit ribosomal protein L25